MLIFARRGNKRMRKMRYQRRDVMIETDRSIIKIIMSKFEILQNNKIVKELQNIKELFSKVIYRDKKESTGFILASDFPRAILEFTKA
jgi:hypothetical protein